MKSLNFEEFAIPRDRVIQAFIKIDLLSPAQHAARFFGAELLLTDSMRCFVVHFGLQMGNEIIQYSLHHIINRKRLLQRQIESLPTQLSVLG